ncbi:MAG: CHASE3 domain-containing protein, partial [Dehalococcoidales bacterium]|nr:CHASE3 domain-containing protein [Dehalococcoidales bacterium]
MRTGLRTRMMAAFLVVLAIASAVTLTGYKALRDRDETVARVAQANEILQRMDDAQLGLVYMENGVRAYLLSGKDQALDPYTTGKVQYQEAMAALTELSAQDPEQLARWEDISKGTKSWISEWAEKGIQLRKDVNAGKADQSQILAFDSANDGKKYMTSVRAKFYVAHGAEHALRASRAEADAAASATAGMIALWGTVLACILGVATSFFLARSLTAPILLMAGRARNLSVGNLNRDIDRRVKQKLAARRDELGDFAQGLARTEEYLVEMATAAERIAGGDLTVQISPRSEHDELGRSFSSMVANLRGLVGRISSSAADMDRASAQLAAVAQQSGAATGQVDSTIQQVAQSTNFQAHSSSQVMESVTSLTEKVNRIALDTRNQ